VRDLLPKMFEYARVSVLMFAQLSDRIPKRDLLAKLDAAMLDANARAEVGEVLASCRVWR